MNFLEWPLPRSSARRENVATLAIGCRYRALACTHFSGRGQHPRSSGQSGQGHLIYTRPKLLYSFSVSVS